MDGRCGVWQPSASNVDQVFAFRPISEIDHQGNKKSLAADEAGGSQTESSVALAVNLRPLL
jgi:hypothetical protein